ncbi:MAG: hypothetical protein ACW9W3_06415 [Candidatus Nitrosopumilus sp. bin_68KS]
MMGYCDIHSILLHVMSTVIKYKYEQKPNQKLTLVRSDVENTLLIREKILSDFAGLSCLVTSDCIDDYA